MANTPLRRSGLIHQGVQSISQGGSHNNLGLNAMGQLQSVPSVYLQAVSRTLELSLQSSFQLSLTVLVDYRKRAGI